MFESSFRIIVCFIWVWADKIPPGLFGRWQFYSSSCSFSHQRAHKLLPLCHQGQKSCPAFTATWKRSMGEQTLSHLLVRRMKVPQGNYCCSQFANSEVTMGSGKECNAFKRCMFELCVAVKSKCKTVTEEYACTDTVTADKERNADHRETNPYRVYRSTCVSLKSVTVIAETRHGSCQRTQSRPAYKLRERVETQQDSRAALHSLSWDTQSCSRWVLQQRLSLTLIHHPEMTFQKGRRDIMWHVMKTSGPCDFLQIS